MTLTFWVLFFALSAKSSKCLLLVPIPKGKRAVSQRTGSARVLTCGREAAESQGRASGAQTWCYLLQGQGRGKPCFSVQPAPDFVPCE